MHASNVGGLVVARDRGLRSRGVSGGDTATGAPGVEGGNGDGPTHVVSLKDVTPKIGQRALDRPCLDALGDQGQAQVVTKGNDALHDHRVTTIFVHGHDERSVDLDLADGQGLELAQAGVPGAEVVQGKPNTQVGERLQHLARPHRVDHDRRLGHLELEQVGRDIVNGQ